MMATPMDLGPEVCGSCFGPSDGGTFDLDDNGDDIALLLVNICVGCRFNEHYQLIKLRAGWE